MSWLGLSLLIMGTFFMVLTSFYVFHRQSSCVPKKVEAVSPPFVTGGMVTLGRENPYKGTLRCEKPYQVMIATPTHIRLWCDNGTMGWFDARHFVPYTGIGRTMPVDASREYEDAIAAQEAMDGMR